MKGTKIEWGNPSEQASNHTKHCAYSYADINFLQLKNQKKGSALDRSRDQASDATKANSNPNKSES